MPEPTPPQDNVFPTIYKNERLPELVDTFKDTKPILEAVAGFAIDHGMDAARLDHLDQVWNPLHWTIARPHGWPPHIFAVTNAWTGDVTIRADRIKDPQIIIHESMHRAAVLARRRDGTPHPGFTVAGILGLDINSKGDVVGLYDSAPIVDMTTEEKQKFFARKTVRCSLATELVNEGVTEWATRKAKELKTKDGKPIDFPVNEDLYKLDTAMIKDIREATKMTEDQVDALLVEVALTGDIAKLTIALDGYLPVAELLERNSGLRAMMKAIST